MKKFLIANQFNPALRSALLAALLLTYFSAASAQQSPTNYMPNSKGATERTEMKRIVFLGTSLTAGFGLDLEQSFPAIIEQKIKEQNLPYTVVNAGQSGDTSAGGLRRVEWLTRDPIDVFVLELGINDALRGLTLSQTEQNLQSIINRVREKNSEVKILLLGMLVPPNMGPEYFEEFKNIFQTLAKQNNSPLVPFLLEGVAGIAELNLPDGIHPTAVGHRLMAETVWKQLKLLL